MGELGCFVGGEVVTSRSGLFVRWSVAVFVSLVYMVPPLAVGTKYPKLFETSPIVTRDA